MYKKLTRMLVFFTACCLLSASMFAIESSPTKLKYDLNTDCMSQLLSRRYSGYSYDNSRLITHEQLQAIVEAGRLAPSSYNEQPWNFIICDRNTNPKAYEKALSALVEFNQGWAKKAPVLIISVAASKSSHKDELNRWSQYDTGAAAFGMMLQAASLGLMAHQMGGFDEAKMRQVFSIPKDFVPMSVMAIGYQSADEVRPERKRKPLTENFFMGSWGKGFE
jgi:nitroreductase